MISEYEGTEYDLNIDFVGAFYSSYLEEFMQDYLDKLHNTIISYNEIKSIRLSFERLTHIDSRGLGILISWFKKINKK
jgi:anti-anti-sigma regulatory factor